MSVSGLRGDGQSVGLADLCQVGRLNEETSDLRAIHALTLQVLPTECGVELLNDDVDVLLTDDHGVAGPVQAGVVHVGHLPGVVGAAGERPDGEEECSADGKDARACGKASGHGLLLEGGRRRRATWCDNISAPPYRSACDDARSRSAAAHRRGSGHPAHVLHEGRSTPRGRGSTGRGLCVLHAGPSCVE